MIYFSLVKDFGLGMGKAMENCLANISNEELLIGLKGFRSKECQVIADVVRYLAEVDERQVYRDYGYSSLFMFCVKGLGYSEGSATGNQDMDLGAGGR